MSLSIGRQLQTRAGASSNPATSIGPAIAADIATRRSACTRLAHAAQPHSTCRSSSAEVAVCMSGQVRTLVATNVATSVKVRLLDSLRSAGHAVDLFMHVHIADALTSRELADVKANKSVGSAASGRDYSIQELLTQGFRPSFKVLDWVAVKALLRPRYVQTYTTSDAAHAIAFALSNLSRCQNITSSRMSRARQYAVQLWAMRQAWGMALRHENARERSYDWVLRTRPDLMYEQPIRLPALQHEPRNVAVVAGQSFKASLLQGTPGCMFWDVLYVATRAAAPILFSVDEAVVSCSAPLEGGSEYCACGGPVNMRAGSGAGEPFAIECLTASHLLSHGVLLLPHLSLMAEIMRLGAVPATLKALGTRELRLSRGGGPYVCVHGRKWSALLPALRLIGTTEALRNSGATSDVRAGCVGSYRPLAPFPKISDTGGPCYLRDVPLANCSRSEMPASNTRATMATAAR